MSHFASMKLSLLTIVALVWFPCQVALAGTAAGENPSRHEASQVLTNLRELWEKCRTRAPLLPGTIPGDPELMVAVRAMEPTARLELLALVSSPEARESTTEWWFSHRLLRALMFAFMDEGDREGLLKVLQSEAWVTPRSSSDSTGVVGELDYALFDVAYYAPEGLDPLLVFKDAYDRGSDGARRAIIVAFRRAFANTVPYRTPDSDFLAACVKWYERNRTDVAVNGTGYGHVDKIEGAQYEDLFVTQDFLIASVKTWKSYKDELKKYGRADLPETPIVNDGLFDDTAGELVRKHVANGRRAELVQMLRYWCPGQVWLKRKPLPPPDTVPIEYYLMSHPNEKVGDGILVLGEVYKTASKHSIEEIDLAFHRAFRGIVRHVSDATYVGDCVKWYTGNRDRVTLNRAYVEEPNKTAEGVSLFIIRDDDRR